MVTKYLSINAKTFPLIISSHYLFLRVLLPSLYRYTGASKKNELVCCGKVQIVKLDFKFQQISTN